jgi:hypothetical protein
LLRSSSNNPQVFKKNVLYKISCLLSHSLAERSQFKWRPHENESTDAQHKDGATCSSDEVSVMEMERRGCTI